MKLCVSEEWYGTVPASGSSYHLVNPYSAGKEKHSLPSYLKGCQLWGRRSDPRVSLCPFTVGLKWVVAMLVFAAERPRVHGRMVQASRAETTASVSDWKVIRTKGIDSTDEPIQSQSSPRAFCDGKLTSWRQS